MRFRFELDDERVFEAEVNDRTFQCTVDRFEFERQFKVSAAVLGQWEDLFDNKGLPRKDADLSGVREEYIAFFCWRELRRRAEGVPDWSEVREHLVDYDIIADPQTESEVEDDVERPTQGD